MLGLVCSGKMFPSSPQLSSPLHSTLELSFHIGLTKGEFEGAKPAQQPSTLGLSFQIGLIKREFEGARPRRQPSTLGSCCRIGLIKGEFEGAIPDQQPSTLGVSVRITINISGHDDHPYFRSR